jgi:hypothetical protein
MGGFQPPATPEQLYAVARPLRFGPPEKSGPVLSLRCRARALSRGGPRGQCKRIPANVESAPQAPPRGGAPPPPRAAASQLAPGAPLRWKTHLTRARPVPWGVVAPGSRRRGRRKTAALQPAPCAFACRVLRARLRQRNSRRLRRALGPPRQSPRGTAPPQRRFAPPHKGLCNAAFSFHGVGPGQGRFALLRVACGPLRFAPPLTGGPKSPP